MTSMNYLFMLCNHLWCLHFDISRGKYFVINAYPEIFSDVFFLLINEKSLYRSRTKQNEKVTRLFGIQWRKSSYYCQSLISVIVFWSIHLSRCSLEWYQWKLNSSACNWDFNWSWWWIILVLWRILKDLLTCQKWFGIIVQNYLFCGSIWIVINVVPIVLLVLQHHHQQMVHLQLLMLFNPMEFRHLIWLYSKIKRMERFMVFILFDRVVILM